MSPCRIIDLRLAWICWVSLAISVHAQSWETGYVLLSNDRVLAGQVEMEADRYLIRKNAGNAVFVPRSQVQAVGHSLAELYQYKLGRMPMQARPGDHYKLARWCLSMQLLAEAGEHYLIVKKASPVEINPAVKRLGIEIKEAMLQQPEFRDYLGLPPLFAPRGSALRPHPQPRW